MIEQPPFWMWIVGFLLVLGPLVTLHELGHLLIGRWLGVKAEAFSVGFGKELAGFNDKHCTRWRISALPLGGYVQFKGDMNPASMPDRDAPVEDGAFQHASLWRRALIVFAGPATNILIAVGIFAAFFMFIGRPVPGRSQCPADHCELYRGFGGARGGAAGRRPAGVGQWRKARVVQRIAEHDHVASRRDDDFRDRT